MGNILGDKGESGMEEDDPWLSEGRLPWNSKPPPISEARPVDLELYRVCVIN